MEKKEKKNAAPTYQIEKLNFSSLWFIHVFFLRNYSVGRQTFIVINKGRRAAPIYKVLLNHLTYKVLQPNCLGKCIDVHSSNPAVVTEICDLKQSLALNHQSLKLCSKLEISIQFSYSCLKVANLGTFNLSNL